MSEIAETRSRDLFPPAGPNPFDTCMDMRFLAGKGVATTPSSRRSGRLHTRPAENRRPRPRLIRKLMSMLTVDISLPDVEEIQKLVQEGTEKGYLSYDEIAS